MTLGAATIAKVQTTAEGGAIVVGNAASAPYAWLVPSTSMTATPVVLDDEEFVAAPLGTTTFVFAKPPAGAPAVYAYDELAGARLTKLSADLPSGFGHPLAEADGMPLTSWARWGTSVDCHIGRIVYTGTTPSLSSVPCGDDTPASIVGARPNGDLIAASHSRAWVITADEITAVADDDYGTLRVAYDMNVRPNKVVGWFGRKAGGQDFACLASHPNRCWKMTNEGTLHVLPGDSTGDGSFGLVRWSYDAGPGTLQTTIFRTIGAGDTTQPLP